MELTIIGGGPGGLYTSILLKRALPHAEVTVVERNAPDDTFGFGVVFSAATLAELEDADPASHDRLSGVWARWDPVEIRYRGEVIRAHGNRFAAISRHVLLHILQARAAEVGVDLRFRTEVEDADEFRTSHLVVAADGVNSGTRRRHAQAFGPQTTVEGSTYVWLGTDKVFDAFTFIFLETEFGPFQAHIYPFSDTRSTFIVECSRAVLHAAGLDRPPDGNDPGDLPPGASDEHTIAFLTERFADHLDSHSLIGNNSKWLDWTTVSNRRWRHDNMVLIGDAAHTAHFSIGSGTKLAMEDAIALVRAVEHQPDDLDSALEAYEAQRRPQVERVQAAASESLAWFDRYPRYLGFPAPMFAYSLLARSERVDHDSLRRRDARLVLAVDRWFAEQAADGNHERPRLVPPAPSMTPLRIGSLALANRAVLVADDPQDAQDGVPSGRLRSAVRTAATGGAGLVLVDRIAVSAEGRATPGDAGLYSVVAADVWRSLFDDLASDRSPVGAVLTHAGPRASMRRRVDGLDRPLRSEGWERVAASALAYTPRTAPPHALDEQTMETVAVQFAAAARAATAAGFDLVEVDMGQGNLLASFLSPLTNLRTDGFGGPIEGRLRFPLQVLAAVGDALPSAQPMTVRFTADDRQPGGITADDAVAAALAFAGAGAAFVHVVTGHTTRRHQGSYLGAFDAAAGDLVRNGAGATTLIGGGMTSLPDADHLLAGGRADLTILGPLPDEPPWLARLRG